MQLKYKFVTKEIGDKICAVPIGEHCEEFRGILQLNPLGAKILKYLEESQSEEEVCDRLCADYPKDTRENIASKLHGFIERLIQEGLLLP